MFTARLDLDGALVHARGTESDVSVDWLRHPPSGFDTFRRSVALPDDADLERCGDALLNWLVHRASGLLVLPDGGAVAGTTVVVARRIGPLWAVAPCRVVAATRGPDRVGFTYVTLPGHPEHGAEEFAFARDETGPHFDVRAVSRPTLPVSRVFPLPQRVIQSAQTRRYLQAALALARSSA